MTHPTKLTLRLDSGLIGLAKDFAHRHDRSLSQIVGDYFSRLAAEPEAIRLTNPKAGQKTADLSPVTRSLLGALSPKAGLKKTPSKPAKQSKALDGDKEAYRKHLEEKYL